MKPKSIKSLLALALLAPGALFAQTTAKTTPVGYITHEIASGESFAPGGAATLISPTLIRPTEFAGVSTVSPSGGAVITFTAGVPADLNDTYVLEISSGVKEGWWSTVASSTATTITVDDAFPSSLPAGTQVTVRKHNTLESFLGFNNPGLVTFNGVDSSDEVQILNPVTQQSTPYAFVTADDLGDPAYPNGAWLNVSSSEPANNTVILPGTCVLVKRIGNSALSFVSTGAVKTTKTEVDIYPDFNFLGTAQAANGTFGTSGLASQLNLWDGVGTDYDELQNVLATQSSIPYAAIDDGGPVMYNISSSDYATTEPIKEGTGMFLKRTGNAASTIVLQGSVVAQ
jgi:hypothetical protein